MRQGHGDFLVVAGLERNLIIGNAVLRHFRNFGELLAVDDGRRTAVLRQRDERIGKVQRVVCVERNAARVDLQLLEQREHVDRDVLFDLLAGLLVGIGQLDGFLTRLERLLRPGQSLIGIHHIVIQLNGLAHVRVLPERTAVERDGHGRGGQVERISRIELYAAKPGNGHGLDRGQDRERHGRADVALLDGEGLRAGFREGCRSGADGILALRVGELFEALGVRRLVLHLKELVRIKIVADNDLEVRLHGGSIDLRRLCILDIDHEVAGDRLAGDVIPIADGQRVCALRRKGSGRVAETAICAGGCTRDGFFQIIVGAVLLVINNLKGQTRGIEGIAHIVGLDLSGRMPQLLELGLHVHVHIARDLLAGRGVRVGDLNGVLPGLEQILRVGEIAVVRVGKDVLDDLVARIVIDRGGEADGAEDIARPEALHRAGQLEGLEQTHDLDVLGHGRRIAVCVRVGEGDGLVALLGEHGVRCEGHGRRHVDLRVGQAVARLPNEGQARGIEGFTESVFGLAGALDDQLGIVLGKNVLNDMRRGQSVVFEGDLVFTDLAERFGLEGILRYNGAVGIARFDVFYNKIACTQRIALQKPGRRDACVQALGLCDCQGIRLCENGDLEFHLRRNRLACARLIRELDSIDTRIGILDAALAAQRTGTGHVAKIRAVHYIADRTETGGFHRIADVDRYLGLFRLQFTARRERGHRQKRQCHGDRKDQCNSAFHTKHPFCA